eukprot:scaffold977_cov253-Pinguiococcus_pyrenoidosus.AAC.29
MDALRPHTLGTPLSCVKVPRSAGNPVLRRAHWSLREAKLQSAAIVQLASVARGAGSQHALATSADLHVSSRSVWRLAAISESFISTTRFIDNSLPITNRVAHPSVAKYPSSAPGVLHRYLPE